jgi:hypothetical protein
MPRAIPKKYFRDHFVLLLLTVNVFLGVLTIIFVLVRLSTAYSDSYITQFRPTLGINKYHNGSVLDLISFSVFAALILVINTALSYKTYAIHRQLTITILSFGILLLILTIIISNALLGLR